MGTSYNSCKRSQLLNILLTTPACDHFCVTYPPPINSIYNGLQAGADWSRGSKLQLKVIQSAHL